MHKPTRDEIRKATVDAMGYEPEIFIEDPTVEAAGIVEEVDSYSLSLMTEKDGEILITEKELKAALKAIKERKL